MYLNVILYSILYDVRYVFTHGIALCEPKSNKYNAQHFAIFHNVEGKLAISRTQLDH